MPRPRRVDGATCHAIDAMPHADEEIGDVAAYVIDQANGDKWDD